VLLQFPISLPPPQSAGGNETLVWLGRPNRFPGNIPSRILDENLTDDIVVVLEKDVEICAGIHERDLRVGYCLADGNMTT
jgi:hypothetical protein